LDSDSVIIGDAIGVHLLTYCPGRDFGCALFFIKNHNQSVGQTGIIFSKLYWAFKMSVSEQQREFNKYPAAKTFKPDIWRGLPKEERRNSTIALTYNFLLGGGKITKVPMTKKRKGGTPDIGFQKDTRAVKAHDKWNRKFFAGDDFTAKGPRFTSKPISERAADQRDVERKGGAAHATFSGAIIDVGGGKLQGRNARHATSEAYIDLVSDDALRASAKRGDRHAQKIVKLIEDSCDDVTDAYQSAMIDDKYNINGIDHAHNAKFKFAA
jgi:hypothetical protein